MSEKKNKKKRDLENIIDPNLQEKLSKDFVVKNMPALSSLSGASYDREPGRQGVSTEGVIGSSNADSHRKIGVTIVGAGLIFIVILFYLAYRFLISPAMEPRSTGGLEAVEIIPVEKSAPENDTVEAISDDGEVVLVEDNDLSEGLGNEEDMIVPELEPIDDLRSRLLLVDSDGDGLSDETEAFLGTDPLKSDSDNDDYSDKEEILNGYNPIGTGTLRDNLSLSLYANTADLYALLYPKAWTLNIANEKSVQFLAPAPDEEIIQVYYEDSDLAYASIIDWYQGQFPDLADLNADSLELSSYGPGIRSADGKFVYFLGDEGKGVFVFSYISATNSMPYSDIFKMMTKTFMRL